MAYVVTNKWLKAGYAEGLRRLFAEDAWVEFMADFGHAKRFFPDADVFPCVIAARRPDGGAAPDEFELAVIPRDDVPRSGLAEAVRAADHALADWLCHEFGLPKLSTSLAEASLLDSDGFISGVRAALPKKAGVTRLAARCFRASDR